MIVSLDENYSRVWLEILPGMSPKELESRLGQAINSTIHIELHRPDPYIRGFGFISVEDSEGRQLVETFNNTKWKGFRLKLSAAKPDFKERLRLEKQADIAERAAKELKLAVLIEGTENEITSISDETFEVPVTTKRIEHATHYSSSEDDDEEEDIHSAIDTSENTNGIVSDLQVPVTIEQSSDDYESSDDDDLGNSLTLPVSDEEKEDAIVIEKSIEDAEERDELGELSLKTEMQSETSKSLAIFSSLLGSVLEDDPEVASTPSRPPQEKAPSGFQSVPRFWGGPTETVEEVNVARTEPTLPTAVAKLDELKSVFQQSTVGKAPQFGFSKTEDPLTLSGFTAISEREPATQAHTFGFSFANLEAQPETTEVAVVQEAPPCPLPSPNTDEPLWRNAGDVAKAALEFMDRRRSYQDSQVHGNVMRDVKRKLRNFGS